MKRTNGHHMGIEHKHMGIELISVGSRYGPMLIPRADSVIGRSLQTYGEWAELEIDYFASLLNEVDTVLDVGANVGTHAIALASRMPTAIIHTFEPQPLLHALLSYNVLTNRLENVVTHPFGCSDVCTILAPEFNYEDLQWNFGAISMTDTTAVAHSAANQTMLLPLDSMNFEGRVQAIKIDVEGMEHLVLKGARELITHDRPLIMFEALTIENVLACREVLSDMFYDLHWIEISAFNDRNFNGISENLWGEGETSVLCIPTGTDFGLDLPNPVIGDETTVPRLKFRSY